MACYKCRLLTYWLNTITAILYTEVKIQMYCRNNLRCIIYRITKMLITGH